jgi:hypothetical protein
VLLRNTDKNKINCFEFNLMDLEPIYFIVDIRNL